MGKIYSVNESNALYWDDATKESVEYFKNRGNKRGKPYSQRYVGSLVADFHRTLLYGGNIKYPLQYKNPDKPEGKLRLLCEASPLAFVVEQAGGMATDGVTRILDLVPTELHQRVPIFIGSPADVSEVHAIFNR